MFAVFQVDSENRRLSRWRSGIEVDSIVVLKTTVAAATGDTHAHTYNAREGSQVT